MIPALARNLLCAIACAALVAGCGGSGHKSSTTKSSTTTAKASTTAGPTTPAAPLPLKLTETALAAGGPAAKPSATATVARGKAVILRTILPIKLAAHPQRLMLRFSRASATSWKVTAAIGREHSTATVVSPGAKPMTLAGMSYACPGPPVPSFCPLRHITASANSTQFEVTTRLPVTLAALAGPLPGVVTPPPASKLLVPTYAIKLEGLAEAPLKPGQTPPKVSYATTVSVSPGDSVGILALLTGHVVGAPQPVTISFAQGPATTITVSAAIPGATPSTVTLKSASGKPIELVSPIYRCSVPPAPTACPPTSIIQSAHHYSFTFPASPTTPIRLGAVVQAG
jgi:hypothetical protein